MNSIRRNSHFKMNLSTNILKFSKGVVLEKRLRKRKRRKEKSVKDPS